MNELDIAIVEYDKAGLTAGVSFEGETINAIVWLGLSELAVLKDIIASAEIVLHRSKNSDEDYVKEALRLVDERNRVG